MEILIGEIIGTAVLVLIGTSTCAAVSLKGSPANGSGWVFIALGWGFAVFAGIVVSTPFSGGHLNPAVSTAFLITGEITYQQFFIYITGEMIGALIGATITFILYYDFFKNTTDTDAILGTFSTIPTIKNTGLNLFSEIIGTFILVYFILMTTVQNDISALFVPVLVIAIGISLGSLTGYAINPFRDLGPRIIHALMPLKNKGSSHWEYSWIPIFGPLIGSGLASLLFMFTVQYLPV